jgi:transcriptional regulator with XRE-family HTH domain
MSKLVVSGERSEAEVREFVRRKIAEKRLKFQDISKEIGKTHSYMSMYLRRNMPKILPDSVILPLARILEVDEDELRANRALPTARALGGQLEFEEHGDIPPPFNRKNFRVLEALNQQNSAEEAEFLTEFRQLSTHDRSMIRFLVSHLLSRTPR